MLTLYGHGYIGNAIAQELVAQGKTFAWQSHDNADIPHGTTAIINAAGYTGTPNVDACEVHRAECVAGNVAWPLALQAIANHEGIHVVHVSSGCIYQGTEHFWTEDDEPNFTHESGASFYSGCKARAEKILMTMPERKTILRVRMPFGAASHAKNLLTKLEGYPKLAVQRQSISHVEDVAAAAVFFADNPQHAGVFNCTNPGPLSTLEIARIMGWHKPFFTAEEWQRAIKTPRSECFLDTTKLTNIFPLRSAREVLLDIAAQRRAAA